LLVLAALIPLLNFLFRFAIPERIGTIFLAALVAHTGWHRMLDRAQWWSSSQFQWPPVDPALLAVAASLPLAGLIYITYRVFGPRAFRSRVEPKAEPVR
jgi:hypothetical protein